MPLPRDPKPVEIVPSETLIGFGGAAPEPKPEPKKKEEKPEAPDPDGA